MSAVDYKSLFEEHGVPFSESGQVSYGNIAFACPFCEDDGDPDPSMHGGLNLATGSWCCWRNRQRHCGNKPHYLLKRLFNKTYGEVKEMLGDAPTVDITTEQSDAHARQSVERANEIWKLAGEPTNTPAETYLFQTRRVWDDRTRFPTAVRWLFRDNAPRYMRNAMQTMSNNGDDYKVGAIVFGFYTITKNNPVVRPGELAAVTCEPLTIDGRHGEGDARRRRTFGRPTGAVCSVGVLHGGTPTIITEGPVSALGARWLGAKGAQVLAAGSCTNFQNITQHIRPHSTVQIWADNDDASRVAAKQLQRNLEVFGECDVKVVGAHTDAKGSDAADLLALHIKQGKPLHSIAV